MLEPKEILTVDSVYGITRDVPANYVVRNGVDQKLIDNLTRNKHIIIYGSSKQGKTCLRKNCLNEQDYIVVQCASKWTIDDINANILKRAGFKLEQSEKLTVSGKKKVNASIGGTIFGWGAKTEGEVESGSQKEVNSTELELDISDVNDVIAALKSIDFNRYIVLEDFHYLPEETQKHFAVALKAFHETSRFCFLIIGVWLEENRLVVYNGDLAGRLVAVDADKWTQQELREVITKGAALLNISFTETFTEALVHESYDSVYIVQEACRLACINVGVTATQTSFRCIGDSIDVRSLVREVVDQQSGRYNSFITLFARGFQETRLEMYKWLLYPILTAEPQDLEKGFSWTELRNTLQKNHPNGKTLKVGNLSQALLFTTSLQVTKDVKPIILDYDTTNRRLNVVDRGFIIWLAHQDREELLASLDLFGQDDSDDLFTSPETE